MAFWVTRKINDVKLHLIKYQNWNLKVKYGKNILTDFKDVLSGQDIFDKY